MYNSFIRGEPFNQKEIVSDLTITKLLHINTKKPFLE